MEKQKSCIIKCLMKAIRMCCKESSYSNNKDWLGKMAGPKLATFLTGDYESAVNEDKVKRIIDENAANPSDMRSCCIERMSIVTASTGSDTNEHVLLITIAALVVTIATDLFDLQQVVTAVLCLLSLIYSGFVVWKMLQRNTKTELFHDIFMPVLNGPESELSKTESFNMGSEDQKRAVVR